MTQVFDTPDGIAYARLATLKGRIKLESKGLRFRGGAIRPQLAAEFGLKPRDPYTAYVAYCETKMAEILANKERREAALADPAGTIPRDSKGFIDWN